MKNIISKNRKYMVSEEHRIVKGEMPDNWFEKDMSAGIKPVYKNLISMLIPSSYLVSAFMHKNTFQAVAKCDAKDEFDEKTGINVCDAKLNLKKHLKAAKTYDRIHRTLVEASSVAMKLCREHYVKAMAIEDDMIRTYGRKKNDE